LTKSTGSYRTALATLVNPPLRADARRNYEALRAAAEEAFTTHGSDAPLDEIARSAGVGNATLYRHFPTRRDLLIAVCIGEVEELCKLGEGLASHRSPGHALRQWLVAYVEHVSSRSGLAAAFATGRREDSDFVTACRDAVSSVAGTLLANAARTGDFRSDLAVADLLALANAVALAADPGDRRAPRRLLELVLAGVTSARPPQKRTRRN